MTALRPSTEPVSPAVARTGSRAFEPLAPVVELVRDWAGGDLEALFLSGSHAGGEAVWLEVAGQRVSLSDLDLYAVMPDERGCAAARRRERASRASLGERLQRLGLAAPLEVAFLTREGLAAMEPRPGSIELRRKAICLTGDAAALDALPNWGPADVSPEEAMLLLENRGLELLHAHERLASPSLLGRAVALHATLKVALDLAGARALAAHVWPEGAEGRVAWARAHGGAEPALDACWTRALAWRRGELPELGHANVEASWHVVARGWCAAWRTWAERWTGARDPVSIAMALAARAPWRRRWRQWLRPDARGIARPGAAVRMATPLVGTPQHRVNAAAALLLHADGVLEPRVRAALARLALPGIPGATWAATSAAVVRCWDRWLLDGQRTGARS